MKCIDFNVSYKGKATTVNIVPLGDVHLGNASADIEAFQGMVDYINKKENTYTILMGDLIDAITHFDEHRFDIDTIDPAYNTPEKQMAAIIKMLKPLADKKKIICMIEGNHEMQLRKRSLIPVAERISSALDIPMIGVQGLIRLNMRRYESTGKASSFCPHIFVHHGWGGGRRTGSVVNKVEEFATWCDADVYLMGHVHQIYGNRQIRLYAPKKVSEGHAMMERKLVFGITGSFLRAYTDNEISSYIEQQGYRPNKIGAVRIVFIPEHRDIHIYS